MDKIKNAFNNKQANIGYVVAGYPSLEYTAELINKLNDSVLDILELGIPYTDPLADGKVIFDASFSASQNGITTDSVFEMLEGVSTDKCLVFLVYANIIYAYGIDKFLSKCKKVGINGLIVPDLPCEENDELFYKCSKLNLSLIPLISVTSEHRVSKLLKKSSGFIYGVGSIGITGGTQTPIHRLKNMVFDIKQISDLPIAIGFGIRTNKDAKEVRTYADGVIMGTALVQLSDKISVDALLIEIEKLFKE
ncbi:MAG: tryptophan synthase subunit alpha [Campylobacter sp.]|nr:tryptophan synthase subunit alpha [Campylobacter sp.]